MHREAQACPDAGAAAPPRVVRRRRQEAEWAGDEETDEDSDKELSDSGKNDNVCHACSETGMLLCCERPGCRRAWHEECIVQHGIAVGDDGEEDWRCPLCTGAWGRVKGKGKAGVVLNPPRVAPGQGGNQRQKRKKPCTEGSPARRAAAKKSGRVYELRFR